MGFFRDLRREFIVWPDAYKGSILFKWPDTNIRNRTQLTAEQDELAVFFRDGKVSGVINPGVSTLDSREIPFRPDRRRHWRQVLKTELYFVPTREFPNLPFGVATSQSRPECPTCGAPVDIDTGRICCCCKTLLPSLNQQKGWTIVAITPATETA